MKFLRFSINDDEWRWYLVPIEDDVILDNVDAEAEIDFDSHEIHIKENKLTLIAVLHELWHLHMDYTFTTSADLSPRDVEEVSAELFSHRGQHIIEQGKQLLSKLIELKETEEE